MGRSKRIVDLLLSLWPLYKLGLWMGRQPGLGSVLKPAFSSKIHQVTMLPVNEPIVQGDQAVLPYALLLELVERSSACFIMNECMCRRHESCHSYPVDLGCLFLGEGAGRIHPSLGKPCDVSEAQAHIQRGMQAGLYPLIAHTVIDALTLGIPYKHMLTVCFCCECCCVVQRGLRRGPAALMKAIQPLPGLRVTVGEGCGACGECVASCPVGAISLNHQGAEIGDECKGCGICLNACSNGAIHLQIDEKTDLLAEFIHRMQGYADITSQSSS
jgi:ferredoxin